MAVATERHRSYSLLDEEEVAQLGRDYRRTLHRTQPEKLALQDKHITTRHADKQHVAAIDSAFRGIRQYSRFDASPGGGGANTAELVLESTPAQMLSALGDDIDRANWAGWTCLMIPGFFLYLGFVLAAFFLDRFPPCHPHQFWSSISNLKFSG